MYKNNSGLNAKTKVGKYQKGPCLTESLVLQNPLLFLYKPVVNYTMKIITKILLIGILMINSSCNREFTSSEMRNNFTENQISDLKLLTDFFTEQVCNENNNLIYKDCFEKLLPEIIETENNPFIENIDFTKQKEIYQSIDKSTFNEIWRFGKSINLKSKIESRNIRVNLNGKYLSFLKEIGTNNPYIEKYVEMTKAIGDFESIGYLQNNIYKYPDKFDLNDPNIQTIIAIHYLSQNDHFNRKERIN